MQWYLLCHCKYQMSFKIASICNNTMKKVNSLIKHSQLKKKKRFLGGGDLGPACF